ncbi:MAG: hypothetical protein ABW143_13150, partial [Acidimicrobiales bacterium]
GSLRVASGLAQFSPDDPRWAVVAPEVVESLVAQEPIIAREWIGLLGPIGQTLGPELKKGFLARRWAETRREVAAAALARRGHGEACA